MPLSQYDLATDVRGLPAQVHAKDKPIPRGGDAVWESDALLHRVAELTIGMAGADLANLLNEASILMVCQSARRVSSRFASVPSSATQPAVRAMRGCPVCWSDLGWGGCRCATTWRRSIWG